MECSSGESVRDAGIEKLRSLIEDLRETLLGENPLLFGPMQVSFTQSYIKLLERELRRRIRGGG
ncbi:MAG: hypothetical protein ABSA74_01220 [Candidatus Staskawiczbacteria bacterium]|jgi:hypothetical protein